MTRTPNPHTGMHLTAYVSFPKGTEPSDAGDWEDAIAKHTRPGFAMVVIVDGTPGHYTIRSAHGMNSGGVGDITDDALRIPHDAGLI